MTSLQPFGDLIQPQGFKYSFYVDVSQTYISSLDLSQSTHFEGGVHRHLTLKMSKTKPLIIQYCPSLSLPVSE